MALWKLLILLKEHLTTKAGILDLWMVNKETVWLSRNMVIFFVDFDISFVIECGHWECLSGALFHYVLRHIEKGLLLNLVTVFSLELLLDFLWVT